MTQDQVEIILILLTMGVAGFALYKNYQRGETVTLASSVEAIKEARPIAIDVGEIVQLAVNGVEQLRREGKITDNNVAFREAYTRSRKWIPDEWEVSEEDLIAAINGAVLVASSLSEQAGKSSEDVTFAG